MADATSDFRALMDAVTDAFAAGDNARAENLLIDALDQGVAWDEVTSAAALGVFRYRQAPRLEAVPAPI